ncbi:class I SAM-dependent methyltransferase [Candidatus Thioglobus sp.]|nr:class I SAM-dependent methyltransferase [Candidatus Thioglobus sp.]
MQSYEDWKNWKNEEFGKTTPEDGAYFSKIKKTFNLNNNLKVLEIGFGNGNFLNYCKNNNWDVCGVEIIPELVDRAVKSGFMAVDSIDAISNKTFDLIVCFDVLEHINQGEVVDFFQKIKNILNANGSLIIRTPNGASPLGLANQYGDVTHVNVVTATKIGYWSNSVGLELRYQNGDVYPIYNVKILKVPTRMIKKILQLLIEKLLRWIFSPQSKGFLSANSLFLIKKI